MARLLLAIWPYEQRPSHTVGGQGGACSLATWCFGTADPEGRERLVVI